jgi:hypothetical protein
MFFATAHWPRFGTLFPAASLELKALPSPLIGRPHAASSLPFAPSSPSLFSSTPIGSSHAVSCLSQVSASVSPLLGLAPFAYTSVFHLAASSAGAPLVYLRPPLPPPSPLRPTYNPPPLSSSVLDSSTPVLNLNSRGKPLTFASAMSGPYSAQWAQGDGDELIKLLETSRTLCPVHFASSTPTYYNRVVKEKWTSAATLLPGHHRSLDTGVARRVRGTAGGDRLLPSCPPSQHVASLPTVNILFNSIVSSSAFFGTTSDPFDTPGGTRSARGVRINV